MFEDPFFRSRNDEQPSPAAEPAAPEPAASETPEPAPDPNAPRPLRIALFTDNYGPSPSGLLYAVQFLEGELLKAGHEVLVVAPAADGPNPYRDHPKRRELRLPSMRIPALPAYVCAGNGFEAALATLKADPPDIIHVHGLGSVGMLGVWAADQSDVPLMVTWHTDFEAYAEHYSAMGPFMDAYLRLLKAATTGVTQPRLADMRNWLSVKWFRKGMSRRALLNAARTMLEAADVVTAPSPKTADRVLEAAPRAIVRVVPNGADALPPGPRIGQPAGPRIIYIGRIAPEKGIPLLLEAFEWVREDLPTAQLMIVGDWRPAPPSLRQKLLRASRKGGVILAGHVKRENLEPYYESADVFAFPSMTDTQALVLHEAAHAGLPIVTVDHELQLVIDPGVNGLIARPTPESLARNLVSMINRMNEDPSFAMRAHARSRELADQYTIANQSAAIETLYQDLAAGRPISDCHNDFTD